MNVYKTSKGTELSVMSLKGKPYMQVAQRIIWFTEEAKNFEITSELLVCTDEQTVARTTVTVFDGENGKVLKKSTATKRETRKDFPDHTEKAETGSLGRALALLGYGTQFAVADLDEGSRIVDSPITSHKSFSSSNASVAASSASSSSTVSSGASVVSESAVAAQDVVAASSEKSVKSGFRRSKAAKASSSNTSATSNSGDLF